MFDRVVSRGLTLVMVSLISAGLGGGLFFLFLAWNEFLAFQWRDASLHGAAAAVTMLCVWWLCMNREDLADR